MQTITIGGGHDARVHVLEVIGNASMGGMESYIKNFIAHLPRDQFRVTCICPYESPFTASLRQLGIEDVFITPIEDDPAWRSIQLTVEVARLHQIDVLHAHMPKAHVLSGLAGCLVHKPVVATVHGMNVTSHELGITRAVGSHLITNCQEAYTQALAMGVPAERVALVRNGVDTAIFTPDSTGDELRDAIDVSQGTPLVGFVGRLEHEKGPDLFLRAAQYVHHLRPDVHFVIIGEGGMRGHLSDMCIQLRLDRQVHFVGWWMNTAGIYPALDLLVHTSRSDGTSLVLLEAMSCACPTVGLAVGGVREIIENESTGLLAGAGDWEGVGIRIIQLLKQPERLRTMGAAARARVEKHFDVRTNTCCAAEVLRNMASQGVNGQRFAINSTMTQEIGGRTSFDNFKEKAK
ncbi:MAG: glycosyltransferase family 1 protein [Segetibacter sp.]|nr:glycosyltransferase family 1 protein [Segetibacter sp.]